MLNLSGVIGKVGPFEVNADFVVKKGERVAIMGRSGSGKTTLFRFISGMNVIDHSERRVFWSGTLTLNGRSLECELPERRNIGVMFQESFFYPNLTLIENIGIGLKFRGASRRNIEDQVRAKLKSLKLDYLLKENSVTHLSGGEKSRLALVRATIWNPELLLCDEPFAALDEKSKNDCFSFLDEALLHIPIPLLFITHEMRDAEKLKARIIECRESVDGKIREFKN